MAPNARSRRWPAVLACAAGLVALAIGVLVPWRHEDPPAASPPAAPRLASAAPTNGAVAAAVREQMASAPSAPVAGAGPAAPAGSAADLAPVYASGRVSGATPWPALRVRAVQVVDARFAWRDDLTFVLHDDGAFELRGRDEGRAPVRQFLDVRAEGCAPVPPVDFRPGDRDLQIHLVPGGEVTARLLVAPSVLAHPEVLRCEWRAAHETEWQAVEPVVDAGGLALAVRSLAADTYALRVRLSGDPEPLFAVGNLVVHAGKALHDPRLHDVDLRHVRAVRLRVVDGDGRVRDLGGQTMPARPDRTDDYGLYFENGVAWVGCRDELDVVLLAAGQQPMLVRGPAQDMESGCSRRRWSRCGSNSCRGCPRTAGTPWPSPRGRAG